MNITQKGKLPAYQMEVLNGKCLVCGTEFECRRFEAVEVEDTVGWVEAVVGYNVICPLTGCGKTVYIPKKGY